MALSSQIQNNGVRSQFMTSRRRRRKRPTRWIVGLAVAVLAVLTIWWIWPDGESRPGDETAMDPLVAAVPATVEDATTSVAARTEPIDSAVDRRPNDRTIERRPPSSATRPSAPPSTPDPGTTSDSDPPAVSASTSEASDPVGETPDVAAATSTGDDSTVAAPPRTDDTASRPAAPKGAVEPATSTPPLLSATESIPARAPAASPNRDEVATLAALIDRDPIRVREELTELVVSGTLSPDQERRARDTLNRINEGLLFSPNVHSDDPFVRTYSVKPGDSLERIARRELAGGPDWRFIQRINGIRNPRGLQINQRLKLPVGTFHAVVDKSEFRMDLFLVDGGRRVLVASYPVGLGELNSTPEGVAKVRKGSKLIDPEWYNPRTSEYFAAGDPKNPIGEHWIGLSSVESGDRLFDGYGIHGTIEPDSIGRSESMGCVRLLPEHVAVVYEMLTEPNSTVEVRR